MNNSTDEVNNSNTTQINGIKGHVKGMTACRVPEDDCISRREAIRIASGYCHPANVAKELAKLPSVQPVAKDTDVLNNDTISRKKVEYKLAALVNEIEDIFSHIRERNEDDSVCGLCEYDGAYIGQSGDWCNECPGFDKSDCFKLKDKYRKEWLDIDG